MNLKSQEPIPVMFNFTKPLPSYSFSELNEVLRKKLAETMKEENIPFEGVMIDTGEENFHLVCRLSYGIVLSTALYHNSDQTISVLEEFETQ